VSTSDVVTTKYTADMVLFTAREGELHVLLITRRWPPFPGKLALPGGHIETELRETAEAAARRECREETGVDAPRDSAPVGRYDEPGRDPRGLYVTHAFSAVLPGAPDPVAADDAKTASWQPVHRVLEGDQLAFDHRRILTDAVAAQAQTIADLLNTH